jgi:aspartate/methionine/tyrosine aminotransferase
LTFSLGGLSKGACLPQMKVGWIAVGGPASPAAEAVAALELIADTYLSVNAPAQAALPALLQLGPLARAALKPRLQANADFLRARTAGGSALSLLDSEAGWSLIVRVPAVLSDEAWARLLLEQDGLLVQPGYFFDLVGGTFLVVSLLPPEEAFQEGIRRLAARVALVVETAGVG